MIKINGFCLVLSFINVDSHKKNRLEFATNADMIIRRKSEVKIKLHKIHEFMNNYFLSILSSISLFTYNFINLNPLDNEDRNNTEL